MNPSAKRLLLLPIALLATAVQAAMLFLAAGRWDLPYFWAYVALYAVLVISGILAIDVGLIEERIRSRVRERIPLASVAKLAMWSHLILAGLDVGRFHWSDTMPLPLRFLGFIGLAGGFGVVVWSMAVNRFFIPTVKIQSERGHHLITTGPYGQVRHPGYAGIIIGVLSSAVALGSWVSAIPMAILVAGFLRRVVVEDQFLAMHLEGYPEYKVRVRFRLLPLVW